MRLVDADKLLEVYDEIHIGSPGNTRKMIESATDVTDLEIFEDILKRGQMNYRKLRWSSSYGDTPKEGFTILMRGEEDEAFLDFNNDGSVCTYEDFEI